MQPWALSLPETPCLHSKLEPTLIQISPAAAEKTEGLGLPVANHPSCRHPAQRGQRRAWSRPLTHRAQAGREPTARQVPGAGDLVGRGWADPVPALTEHTAHDEMQTSKRTIATICTAGPETATLGAPGPKIQAWDGITESVRPRLNPEGRKFRESEK